VSGKPLPLKARCSETIVIAEQRLQFLPKITLDPNSLFSYDTPLSSTAPRRSDQEDEAATARKPQISRKTTRHSDKAFRIKSLRHSVP
jgi:hypothetical protein